LAATQVEHFVRVVGVVHDDAYPAGAGEPFQDVPGDAGTVLEPCENTGPEDRNGSREPLSATG
jgi:hypothetical protein